MSTPEAIQLPATPPVRSSVSLACRAKRVREMCNLTRTEAAKRLGVSISLVSLWEADKRTISPEQSLLIATAYGVSLDFLLNADVMPIFKLPNPKRKKRSVAQANAPAQRPPAKANAANP